MRPRYLTRKTAVEEALRHVMVRTERLAVTEDRNGMLSEVAPKNLHLRSSDLKSYVGLARVAKALEHHDVVEYWKSAPHILNFMDEYKLPYSLTNSASSSHAGTLPQFSRMMYS